MRRATLVLLLGALTVGFPRVSHALTAVCQVKGGTVVHPAQDGTFPVSKERFGPFFLHLELSSSGAYDVTTTGEGPPTSMRENLEYITVQERNDGLFITGISQTGLAETYLFKVDSRGRGFVIWTTIRNLRGDDPRSADQVSAATYAGVCS
jgi:hypothetical protein